MTRLPGSPRRTSEHGFALLLVFLMAAAVALMLYQQLPRVAFESERAKEQLLIDRGEQYRRAIQLYFAEYKRYPAKIEDLENTNNKRYLRRRYVDPYTGKDDWRLVHTNGMMLTDSLVQKPPAANANGSGSGSAGAGGTGIGTTPGQTANNAAPGPNTLPPVGANPADPNAPPAVNAAVYQRPSDRTLPNAANFPGQSSGGSLGFPPQPGFPQEPSNSQANNSGYVDPASYPPITLFPNGYNAPQQPQGQVTGRGGQGFGGLANAATLQGAAPGFPQPVNPSDPNSFQQNLQNLQNFQQQLQNQNPGFPGQQLPGQPFPAQQSFPGQPQFPGQPAQQFQRQQFPGQQFPGQQFPGQQFPGQAPGQVFPQGTLPPGVAGGVTVPGMNPGLPPQNQPQVQPVQNPNGNTTGGFFNPPNPAQQLSQMPNPQAGNNGLPPAPNQALNIINQILTTPRQPPAGIGPAPNQVVGGGIAGVASTHTGPAIKSYDKHTNFEEWEFVFQPQSFPGQPPATQPNLANTAGGSAPGIGVTPGAGGPPGIGGLPPMGGTPSPNGQPAQPPPGLPPLQP